MQKRQLIDEIRLCNPTAQPQFLAQFDESALKQYLEHLKAAQLKRMKLSAWVEKINLRMVS